MRFAPLPFVVAAAALAAAPAVGAGHPLGRVSAPEAAVPARADAALPVAPAEARGAELKSGLEVYRQKCQVCHGAEGRGDGPGAAKLDPKPRSFRDGAWQDSVTDEYLRKVIVEGGPAVGKSPAMPATPALRRSEEELSGLVLVIRGFRD